MTVWLLVEQETVCKAIGFLGAQPRGNLVFVIQIASSSAIRRISCEDAWMCGKLWRLGYASEG